MTKEKDTNKELREGNDISGSIGCSILKNNIIITPKGRAMEIVNKYEKKCNDCFLAIEYSKTCTYEILNTLDLFNTNDTKEDSEIYKFYQQVIVELDLI